ncbi:ExbD/TolR family protein [Ningiella sp. W23]|uniref:ExbD/TolR family protein n=1 Tax=Ningiella sp. W23 TaxID=3023715 RepID=UPI003756E7A0
MLNNRSSSKARRRGAKSEAELDITSFMNLMIVLVPVLLMMMVFSRITVVELSLPGIAQSSSEEIKAQVLEVQVNADGLEVYFPQGYLVASIPKTVADAEASRSQTSTQGISPGAGNTSLGEGGQAKHDFVALQNTLKQIKQTLISQEVDKKDLSLLLQQDTDYQTIVSLIDASRSYKDVVVASVVDAELFPEVSLADAVQTSVQLPANASQEQGGSE